VVVATRTSAVKISERATKVRVAVVEDPTEVTVAAAVAVVSEVVVATAVAVMAEAAAEAVETLEEPGNRCAFVHLCYLSCRSARVRFFPTYSSVCEHGPIHDRGPLGTQYQQQQLCNTCLRE
jgi:hypothetical protein